ncbi:hypothetical protein [Roseateles sp. P5_D6]
MSPHLRCFVATGLLAGGLARAWGDVKGWAWVTLAQHRMRLSQNDSVVVQTRVMELADELVARWRGSAYRVGMQAKDYVWGSNAVQPARSYLDHFCSYASNEVAVNWNAPLVYVSAAQQALTPRAR